LVNKGDESVRNEIYTLEPKEETKPTEILKSTYVLESLGLEDNYKYHEKGIEQGIIDHLQHLILLKSKKKLDVMLKNHKIKELMVHIFKSRFPEIQAIPITV
jgi:hypothetical protein